MPPIIELRRSEIGEVKVIMFDVDGVTVPRGTKIRYKNDDLYLHIKKCPKSIIKGLKQLSKHFHINISSGRSLLYLLEMYQEILDVANLSFTVENGHYTYFNNTGEIIQHYKVRITERQLLNKIRKNIEKRGEIEPKEMFLTLHTPKRLHGLQTYDLQYLYNGEAYDIGYIDKGHPVSWFKNHFGKVLAIGDNYNDKEMLENADISVTVDKSRVAGMFYIDYEQENMFINILPAEILINHLLKLRREMYGSKILSEV